jgi:hypothetical protein
MSALRSTESEIELFEGSSKLLKPVFETFQEHEKFRQEFYESLREDFDKLAAARRVSEEEAMRRWYR